MPVPSVVCEPDMVGLGDVLQQTPLPVIRAPPSDMTFPPLAAVVGVMEEGVVVVTIGGVVLVTNVTSLPYVVPTELVA
jgi:hypothetical protein